MIKVLKIEESYIIINILLVIEIIIIKQSNRKLLNIIFLI